MKIKYNEKTIQRIVSIDKTIAQFYYYQQEDRYGNFLGYRWLKSKKGFYQIYIYGEPERYDEVPKWAIVEGSRVYTKPHLKIVYLNNDVRKLYFNTYDEVLEKLKEYTYYIS